MSKSKVDKGREFFASLYEDKTIGNLIPDGEYQALVTRLVVKTPGNIVAGDQALQSLMTNFVLSNAKDFDQVQDMAAVLAGIKQLALGTVLESFPKASIEELVAAAQKAGYEVKVLGD